MFIRDPDALLEKKLAECGEAPKLSEKQMAKFANIIL